MSYTEAVLGCLLGANDVMRKAGDEMWMMIKAASDVATRRLPATEGTRRSCQRRVKKLRVALPLSAANATGLYSRSWYGMVWCGTSQLATILMA